MYVQNKTHNYIAISIRRKAARKELFQYSVRKKMDNGQKTQKCQKCFVPFASFFSQRGQLQLVGNHNMSRKGARIEAKMVHYKILNL